MFVCAGIVERADDKLMFEHPAVGTDGHVADVPRDAFWKSGAGGFALIIVPSLDLVIYKMGGNNGPSPR